MPALTWCRCAALDQASGSRAAWARAGEKPCGGLPLFPLGAALSSGPLPALLLPSVPGSPDLAQQQVLLLPDKTDHECTSITSTSLTVMYLYCLQASVTAHFLALCNSFYYLPYSFSYDSPSARLQKSVLCFWCWTESTGDVLSVFVRHPQSFESLTFFWWRTLRHLRSEGRQGTNRSWPASCGVSTNTHGLGAPEEGAEGGCQGWRGDPCPAGRVVALCSQLPVPYAATGPFLLPDFTKVKSYVTWSLKWLYLLTVLSSAIALSGLLRFHNLSVSVLMSPPGEFRLFMGKSEHTRNRLLAHSSADPHLLRGADQ